MEQFSLKSDMPVFYLTVTTFPDGIRAAFDKLVQIGGRVKERAYYGISYLDDNGTVIYKAAAQVLEAGEAERFNCGCYTIEKGEYLVVPVKDWISKTGNIKDVFGSMMQDSRVDLDKPCIEWYKEDTEMWCMMQVK